MALLLLTAVLLGGLTACQSTRPAKEEAVDISSETQAEILLRAEMTWVQRAEALHAFLLDYYGNPRAYKARNVLGLPEMQRLILKNRSEGWQPHLQDRSIRVSWSIDRAATEVDPSAASPVSDYQWSFSEDWMIRFRQRIHGYRRAFGTGLDGLALWILPKADFEGRFPLSVQAELAEIGVVVTHPGRAFFPEEGILTKALSIDESGVYLEATLADHLRVRHRINLLINDVPSFEVDSSHRFLNRERVRRAAEKWLQELQATPELDPQRLQGLEVHLAGEAAGRLESIEWLDRTLFESERLVGEDLDRGFKGLWDAYLRKQLYVARVPGLEYQSDPDFLRFLDDLVEIYLDQPVRDLARSPSGARPQESRAGRLSLEFDENGPVLGLIP